MRYALISDIHSNLPALQAVLDDIRARPGIDATYHLGDLVGYAPWPNETVSLLKGFHIEGIAGNYDSTVATDYKHCGCKYEDPRQEELAHISYEWTRQHVNPSTKEFLGALPFRLDLKPQGGHTPGPTVILVHGTPTLNTLYWTEDRPDSFCSKMASMAGAKKGDVICFGHTHKPWHREVEGIHFFNTRKKVPMPSATARRPSIFTGRSIPCRRRFPLASVCPPWPGTPRNRPADHSGGSPP